MSLAGIQIGAGVQLGSGISVNPALPTLVLNLDANNPSSYSGSGTTWYDVSGFGNNVDMVNSGDITFWTGSPSYFATGETGYFSGAGSSGIPVGNTLYTLACWVNSPGQGTWGANGLVSIGGYGEGNQSNAFRTASNPILVNYWWGDDFAVGTTAPSTGWFYAVVTYDGIHRNMYVNGVLQGTDTPSGTHNVVSSTVQVAATDVGLGEYLNGNIGAVYIYNYALSGADILANFNATRSIYGV